MESIINFLGDYTDNIVDFYDKCRDFKNKHSNNIISKLDNFITTSTSPGIKDVQIYEILYSNGKSH